MKARLTLTVDPKVSHPAKDYAQRQGLSLSGLVEKLLSEAVGRAPQKKRIRFSERWKGCVQVSDSSDRRAARLRGKYKLPGSDAPLS
jgi:hypothetical protein